MSDSNKAKQTVLRLKVDTCPRCAGAHESVEYRPFAMGDQQFTHWAFCETIGEPLLLDTNKKSSDTEQFTVRFLGTGQKAKCLPNPAYPEGVHIKAPASGVGAACVVQLPWPAPEIGAWKVECIICGAQDGLHDGGPSGRSSFD